MSLESIARNKLSLSSSSNLHRWVLLKNSILATPPRDEQPTPPAAFMFPTSYSYPDPHDDPHDDPHARSSEALWLDTLLQSLAHDEDDDDEPPIEDELDDDDDPEEDPDLLSPMSSSDDLSQHPFVRYYPRRSPLAPLPLPLPFPFSHLDVLDDSIDFSSDDPDSDPLKCSDCSSSTSTSPSSSASSLPPSTPPSSPLRSWAAVPKFPLPPLPPSPALYIDAYSDPLPFSHTFSYDFHTPFVFHPC